MDIELSSRQQEAVDLMCNAPVGCVAGFAGTGKTTCVREAVRQMGQVFLAAPTGKAAKRLTQVTGKQATTIHRLFNASEDDGFGARWDPFGGAFVFDEASMIDQEILYAISACIVASESRVIFVGDPGQLPSIGPGAVLRDLMATVPTVVLDEVHRSAAHSWMAVESAKIRQGQMPSLTEADDFEFVSGGRAGRLQRGIVERYLASRDQGEPLTVITPRNDGIFGRKQLNEAMQSARVAREPEPPGMFERPGAKADAKQLYVGDPVVQIVNNPAKGIVNGDVGKIFEIGEIQDPESTSVKFVPAVGIEFEGSFGEPEQIWYTAYQSYQLFLAYALTIHRAQGSEWPEVIVVCMDEAGRMLNRELLYTAVTRAKSKLTIVGSTKAIESAIRETTGNRRTQLARRLQEGSNGEA